MTTRTSRAALLGASLLGLSGLIGTGALAYAQGQAAPVYDPAQLPVFHGKVAQYDLTPRGDVDGLILDDGTEVHMPPHLGTQVVAAVKPGDTVTIHGLKARELNLVQAMSLANDAGGATVVAVGGPAGPPHHGRGLDGPDHGPRPEPGGPMGGPGMGPEGRGAPDGGSMQAHGAIKMQLHGPRGDLNGVLLADGTMVHLPPPAAARLAAQLAPGQTLFVRGDGTSTVLGKSIDAHAIGASADQLTPIRPPHPGGKAE